MDRVSRKMSSQIPKIDVDAATIVGSKTSNIMNTVSKWVPLICAAAAVGVSVIALKEIKNVRKELYGGIYQNLIILYKDVSFGRRRIKRKCGKALITEARRAGIRVTTGKKHRVYKTEARLRKELKSLKRR